MIDPELGPVRWCRRCGEAWPLDAEFWYFERKRPTVPHCRACKAEASRRSTARKPHWCPTCLSVRTREAQCHGCAGRIAGPLTVAKLAEWGLAPVVSS